MKTRIADAFYIFSFAARGGLIVFVLIWTFVRMLQRW